MSRATLAVDALPALGPTARRVTVDCRHGRTTVALAIPAGELPLAVGQP